ncbi:MAG: YigZ family protein [Bacillota bacterium]|nr:YigZ family protein [Bacillota bacterium]
MPRIKEDCINTIEIKKSKFITYLHRTDNEEDAKEFLKRVKKEHPSATHHCTAMIIGDMMRSNDDGEPSQTAGHPMLDVLIHHEMNDIIAVVVRYFGGIKLGTGGLVRAYSGSVQEALKVATLTESTTFHEYEIQFAYDLIGRIDAYFRKNEIEITQQDYQEKVIYRYLCLEDISNDLQEISGGAIHPTFIQDRISEKTIC